MSTNRNGRKIAIDATKEIEGVSAGLYTVAGKTLVARLLEQCIKTGPSEIIIITPAQNAENFRDLASGIKNGNVIIKVMEEKKGMPAVDEVLFGHIIYDRKKGRSGEGLSFVKKWEIGDRKDIEYAAIEVGKDALYPCARHYIRPLAQRLAVVLSKTKISANQVTFFGAFVGLAASVMIFLPFRLINILAGFFVIFWTYLDHVDGYLARITKTQSKLGEYLDSELGSLGLNLHFIALGSGVWIFRENIGALLWLVGYLFGNYLFFHSINTRAKIRKDIMQESGMSVGAQKPAPLSLSDIIKRFFAFFDDVDLRIHIFALCLVLGIHYQFLIFQSLYFNLRWISNMAYEFMRPAQECGE